MNCENCGGPLTWTPGRDVQNCGYCGSYRPLPHDGDSRDRVTLLGEPSERSCPACGTLLERAAVDRVAAEACQTCRGVLLDDEAFAYLVRTRRSSFRGSEVPPQPLDHERLTGRVDCPNCGTGMDRHCYYGPGNQVIDCCSPCGLIWLDSGELAAIEAAPGRR